MPFALKTPDRLFDRLWKPGHPFRPRRSRVRRRIMLASLIVLTAMIGVYGWLTDPDRLRGMAESYLSDLLGGRVHVGQASLTIFEGLRLSRITVWVSDPKAPDAVLLVADDFNIEYDPAALLRGQLAATRIIATSPKVKLVENVDAGSWNYQRLHRSKQHSATEPGQALPEIVLRDAEIQYSEIHNGRFALRGIMAIEGRLQPSPDSSRYTFTMQSRGDKEGVGPVVSGQVHLSSGEIDATLSHFRFGPDIEAMLPSQVRQWWMSHQLEGSVDIPNFRYTPPDKGQPATFTIPAQLQHVSMTIPLPHPPGQTGPAPAIVVQDVNGNYVFDDNGITMSGVTGRIENNAITLSGRIDGYSSDSTAHLKVVSMPGEEIRIPKNLSFVSSLPPDAKRIYDMLKPSGAATLALNIDRPVVGGPITVSGPVQLTDAEFTYDDFPYPVRKVSGSLLFDVDPATGFQRVELQHLVGHGVAGGPNADSPMMIDGWVGPFDPRVGLDIHIVAKNISGEPEMFAAFPKPVHEAIERLSKGTPHVHGDAVCDVTMPIGIGTKATVATDIQFDDVTAELTAFPYPLTKLNGTVKIREGYCDVINARMNPGNASWIVNGRVSWHSKIIEPALHVQAKDVPIDDDLLSALPPSQRQWVNKAGLAGRIDVDGKIFATDQGDITYDAQMLLHDGSLRPIQNVLAVSDVSGKFRLTQSKLEVQDVHGRRGDAELSAAGNVDISGNKAMVKLTAAARKLSLDDSLYKLLPPAAVKVWDAIRPAGLIDADLSYSGDLAAAFTGPSTQPVGEYSLALEPHDLSIYPKVIPYRLDHCNGTVMVTPAGIRLDNITAKHGDAAVTVVGNNVAGPGDNWDLKLLASDVPVDADLSAAVPLAVAQLIDTMHLHGKLTLDLASLKYRDADGSGGDDPDIDASGVVRADGASLNMQALISDIFGGMSFNATVRKGKMDGLHGQIAVDQLSLAGRPVRNLKADLDKPAGDDSLRIDKIEGELAGGRFAGAVNLAFPDKRPSSYSLNVVLKNADMRTVTGQAQDIRGQLSASLALEGEWVDTSTRRGRGDATVSGKNIYQIPLLLGLWDVTNLSLPALSPFSEGTARYSVDGQRITFEQIQMRSNTMVMGGSGWLDFGSKQVRMTFSTDNPNWPTLPLVSDLLQGAKQELMQIQVKGTVQDPKVSASTLHTFTTTVDKVFSGNGADK
jgi:hypothetical protein